MQLSNQSIPNPRNQARSTSIERRTKSDCIYKMIDAANVGAMALYDRLASMDLALTPNAHFLMQLCNQSILNPRNQARSARSGVGDDSGD